MLQKKTKKNPTGGTGLIENELVKAIKQKILNEHNYEASNNLFQFCAIVTG